jgi:hypothetical protein
MLQWKLSWMLPLAVLLLFAGGCAAPQAGPREDSAASIDPKAAETLEQMGKVLGGAQAISCRVQALIDKPQDTGQLVQFSRTSEITAVRPDRLCAKTNGDDGAWAAWYDGKTLTLLARGPNTYATEQVPGRIGEMLDYMVDKYDMVMPMADLLVPDVRESLLANVEEGVYMGIHSVGDRKCHHLLFRQENIDWQIWIDADGQPLPRKLVITYKQEPGQPQYVATFDDWNLSPTIPAETFTFSAPAGAEAVTMSSLLGKEVGE